MNDLLTLRESPHESRRDLTARTLHVRAATINEAERSVEAVLATEARTLVFDMRRWEVIEEILIARGAVLPEQVVLLESHNRWTLDSVFGSVRGMRIEGENVIGRLHFAEGDERIDSAWLKVRQGHITDVSAGYRSIEYVDIKPNTTQKVNGRSFTAGDRTLRITTRWELREGSLVPIGADANAKIREDAVLGKEIEAMNMAPDLRKHLEACGLRSEATEAEAWEFFGKLQGEQKTRAWELGSPPAPAQPQPTIRAAPEPAPVQPVAPAVTEPRTAPAINPETVRQEAVVAERERVASIRELGGQDVPAELVTRAIDDGWDTARASREFLEALREARHPPVAGNGPAIHARDHETDCTVRALGMGLVHRAGLAAVPPNASDQTRRDYEQLAEQSERYRDISMVDVCREALRMAGHSVPVSRHDTIRAAVSTVEMSHIFTTVVNAALLSGYETTPDTTGPFVREADVPDFKSNERIKLGKGSSLDRHVRGGTAKHATRSSSMEEYKVHRYSKQFVVDEMDIIDDRFNALLDMPNEMGEAARRIRPDLVYSILMGNPDLSDSVALFHAATHGNLDTSSALASATLIAAITAMATQQEDGVNLGIFPKCLIVPQALKFTADVLIRSQETRPFNFDATSGATVGIYNPLANQGLTSIADSRLDNGVTDPSDGTAHTGSATTWFVAATGGRHTIEVGYLRGTGRAPMLRSFVLTEGQWGLGWDVKMDVGAKALDYRGLHKSTG
jgi:hypothetical protein